MAKRKRTKRQTTIHKALLIKLKSSNTNPTKKGSELKCSGRLSSSCPTSGTRRVTLVTKPVITHE